MTFTRADLERWENDGLGEMGVRVTVNELLELLRKAEQPRKEVKK
jgi:hypothetical protein